MFIKQLVFYLHFPISSMLALLCNKKSKVYLNLKKLSTLFENKGKMHLLRK